MARTPPPPNPGTSCPPLMPHASFALSAPSPQGHSPFLPACEGQIVIILTVSVHMLCSFGDALIGSVVSGFLSLLRTSMQWARTPPPPTPGTSCPPLMPHASYALSAPSPQGHSPFFSPLGQPPFFTPLGLAGVWLVPVPGPPLPRGTLRFAFLSDDKPRRSPQRAIFFVSVAFICYLLSAFLSSCVSVP